MQGVVVYAVASAAPLLLFAFLGPIIRKKCPEGFVLTEWTRQRYGVITALYLSFLTLVTMFLYMVAELSALQQIMTALTGMGKRYLNTSLYGRVETRFRGLGLPDSEMHQTEQWLTFVHRWSSHGHRRVRGHNNLHL